MSDKLTQQAMAAVKKKSSAGKSGNKRQKSGRVKRRCERYRARRRHEFNQCRNLVKHLKKHPNDLPAKALLGSVYDANVLVLSSQRQVILKVLGEG